MISQGPQVCRPLLAGNHQKHGAPSTPMWSPHLPPLQAPPGSPTRLLQNSSIKAEKGWGNATSGKSSRTRREIGTLPPKKLKKRVPTYRAGNQRADLARPLEARNGKRADDGMACPCPMPSGNPNSGDFAGGGGGGAIAGPGTSLKASSAWNISLCY